MSDDNKAKYLQPIAIALSIAIISAASSMMYRHEGMIGDESNRLTALSKEVYRINMRGYEYHNSLVSAQLRTMELKDATNNGLSVAEQAWVSYLENLKEEIEERMLRTIEEGKKFN